MHSAHINFPARSRFDFLFRPVVEPEPLGPPFVFAHPLRPPLHLGTTRLHLLCLFLLVAAGFVPLFETQVSGPGVIIHGATYIWGSAYDEPIPTEWTAADSFTEGYLRMGSVRPFQYLYLFACFEFIRRALLPHVDLRRKRSRLAPFRRMLSFLCFGLTLSLSVPILLAHIQIMPGFPLVLFPSLLLAWYALEEARERTKKKRLFAWRIPLLLRQEQLKAPIAR